MPVEESRVNGRHTGDHEAPEISTLSQVLDLVWAKLSLGAEPKSSDYHVASIATIDPQGWPSVRSVVLRKTSRSQNLVVFHTDSRAPKFQHIQSNDRVAWLFYSRRDKIQIRLQTRATVHLGDQLAHQTFDTMPARCQRVYMAPDAPGALAGAPTGNLPPGMEDRTPSPDEARLCRSVFAVIDCHVESIDWLYLAATGHRRAIFCWDGKQFAGSWAAP